MKRLLGVARQALRQAITLEGHITPMQNIYNRLPQAVRRVYATGNISDKNNLIWKVIHLWPVEIYTHPS